MIRLFVALEIPAAVRENLATLIDELRAADAASSKSNPRWVRPENLHVTLKFIGHVEADKLDAIHAALAEVRSGSAVELRFRGLGFFPNDRRPRVLWAGMDASANLVPLASEIDAGLEKLGIPRETREFAPHLTLARFDPPGISEKLRGAARKNPPRKFGELCAGEFDLIESKTRPTGAEYTRLSSFAFVKAEA
jgi:RNA 2',3'-cyclic 3'-phosphodiesterase